MQEKQAWSLSKEHIYCFYCLATQCECILHHREKKLMIMCYFHMKTDKWLVSIVTFCELDKLE